MSQGSRVESVGGECTWKVGREGRTLRTQKMRRRCMLREMRTNLSYLIVYMILISILMANNDMNNKKHNYPILVSYFVMFIY